MRRGVITATLLACAQVVAAASPALLALKDREEFKFAVGRTQVCMEDGFPTMSRMSTPDAATLLIRKCGVKLNSYLRGEGVSARESDDLLEALAYRAIERSRK